MDILTKIFKAVANERRGKIILFLLKKGELTVSKIAEELKMSFKTTSAHLLKLENVGLVKRRQRGLWAYYSLNHEPRKPLNLSVLRMFKDFQTMV